jgi:hypothetical protein
MRLQPKVSVSAEDMLPRRDGHRRPDHYVAVPVPDRNQLRIDIDRQRDGMKADLANWALAMRKLEAYNEKRRRTEVGSV